MSTLEPQIGDVSDTSLWVAYYRAKETRRPDALFQDPLASVLIGERGKRIAEGMKVFGRYVEWSVIGRTVIIDDFILERIQEGIDTVVNLGAGLDTRPYRMNLPPSLNWIEADYPHIIGLKNARLQNEKPRCRLTRVEVDLADGAARTRFLAETAARGKKTLVITEGVVPYLTQAQVGALADDLHSHPSFQYWITEYFSPLVYKHLQGGVRAKKMKNAPFRFYPADWNGFFEKRGWTPIETRYLGLEALRQKRAFPMPWWAKLLLPFISEEKKQRSLRMTGYMVLSRA